MKQIWSKSLACLLCLALLVGMLPVAALAEDPEISYIDAEGSTKTCPSATAVTGSDTTWGADDNVEHWYVVNGNVTISSRVTVTGEVHLILANGCILNASQGINVTGDNSLTIYAQSAGENMGALTADGRENSFSSQAGIGGNDNQSGGTITINGGTVTAIGGSDGMASGGAGIGGGGGGAGGELTINGGTVDATGVDRAAGIGGGSEGAGGNITINGGTVNATGSGSQYTSGGAGIGGGVNGAGGNITINGGAVNATSGGNGAGIGGGEGGGSGTFSTGDSGCAVIFASSISDQSSSGKWSGVIFQGQTGAVYGTNVTPTEDFIIPENYTLTIKDGQTLTISEGITLTNNGTIVNNGTINGKVSGNIVVDTYYMDTDNKTQNTQANLVTTGSTTWTDSDPDGGWYVVNDDIEISQRVTVTGNVHLILADGCKLTASQGINVTGDNSLTIYAQSAGDNMGALTANGGDYQAGIGSGQSQPGGTITINGGKVGATGGLYGAGIGGGYNGAGGTIIINSGRVKATGGKNAAGIGGGNDGAGGDITITGGIVNAESYIGAGIGSGDSGKGGSISISGGTITAQGNKYGAGIGIGEYGNDVNIIITGGTVTAISQFGAGIDSGDNGTFSTGTNGCAVIIASSISDSDSDGTTEWSGVIFQGKTGAVYGTNIAPIENFTISEEYELTIEKGQTLTISEGITLTNNGTITVESCGALVNQGTIVNNGTIQLNGGSTVQIGDGPAITIGEDTTGETVGTDGGITLPDGGSATIGSGDDTTTITTPGGGTIKPNYDGTVTVPDGSTVQTGDGPEMTLPDGGTIDPDTGAVMPDAGGSVVIGSGEDTTTITPPSGGVPVIPNGDGTVTVPDGSTVQTGNGPEMTLPDGGTVDPDTGAVTPDAGGSVVIGSGEDTITITPPSGAPITPNGDGSFTIPGGSTVADKNGDEYTYPPEGGSLDQDGTVVYTVTVTFDSQGGSEVASKDINVNNPVEEPANPTRSGYSFRGWYTAASGGERWDFTKPVAADMTLYAQWSWINVGGPTYPPTMDEPENGTVTTSPSRPEEGDAVTITPKPDEGFEVDEILVKDENGNPVEVTQNPDGTYTFTQPDGKVTITVTFRCDGGELCPGHHLTDVSKDAWYHAAVDYAVEHGIMEGVSETEFSPNTEVTRAQAVQILYNLEGQPTVDGDNEFTDVFGWYEAAVTWAAQTGVATGYGDGTFQPGDNITRQEFAQMLYNYAKYKGYDLSAEGDLSQFPDSGSVADWAEAAMRWANGNELINGHDDGTIDAAGTAIRAQAASILMKFDQNLTEE